MVFEEAWAGAWAEEELDGWLSEKTEQGAEGAALYYILLGLHLAP